MHSGHRLAAVIVGVLALQTFTPGPSASAVTIDRASTPPLTATAAPSSAHGSAEASRDGGRLDTGWKCERRNGSIVKKVCVSFLAAVHEFSPEHSFAVVNDTPESENRGRCTIKKTTTVEFGGSATLEAEAGVIFAKAKTVVSAHASRATSTERAYEVDIQLPPRSVRYCQTGVLQYRIRGKIRYLVDEPGSAPRWSEPRRFHGDLPTVPGFRITTPRRFNG